MDAKAPALQPGDELAGRYRVIALLGRGGMGEVDRDWCRLHEPRRVSFTVEGVGEVRARFRIRKAVLESVGLDVYGVSYGSVFSR